MSQFETQEQLSAATAEIRKLTDEELLDRLVRAYYAQKECQRRAEFDAASMVHEEMQLFKTEALNRMQRLDPVLRRHIR